MKLVLVGMNHRTSPLEVRERYALDETGPALAKLGDGAKTERPRRGILGRLFGRS